MDRIRVGAGCGWAWPGIASFEFYVIGKAAPMADSRNRKRAVERRLISKLACGFARRPSIHYVAQQDRTATNASAQPV